MLMSFEQRFPLDQSAPSFDYYGYQVPSNFDQQQAEQTHNSQSKVPQTQSSHRHNMSYTSPVQKDTEEADTSSRPRLTAEQTHVLEQHFSRDHKPVTADKKKLAQQIGLTLDKVNVSD